MTKITDAEDFALTPPDKIAADLEQAHRDAYPRAVRFGYTVDEAYSEGVADGFSYTRPDGDLDSEVFDTEAEAWDAAESDAGLWEQDHGDGIDALETLEAMRAILATVNGNSEPYAMADALGRLDAMANGKPDPGRADPGKEEIAELEAFGYRVEPDGERFLAFDPGQMDFSPNGGFATEGDAWAACRHQFNS